MKRLSIIVSILLLIVLRLLVFIRGDTRKTNKQAGVIQDAEASADVYLQVAFLDIGQGDATFITFPNSVTMLVDCAKDARILEALGRVMTFFERRIDYMVVTHPDLDHYGGCIDVMKRFDVGTIVYNGFQKHSNSFWREFMEAIEFEKESGAEYIEMDREHIWDIASTTVHFLYPDAPVAAIRWDSNNSSIVLKLSFGDQDVLLTGDAEKEVEEYLVETYGDALDVEILKAGHHGSGSSSIQDFIDVTSPDAAVISAGKDNSYGHPSLRVVRRLERAGADILRTDMMGDILVDITQDSIYVRKE